MKTCTYTFVFDSRFCSLKFQCRKMVSCWRFEQQKFHLKKYLSQCLYHTNLNFLGMFQRKCSLCLIFICVNFRYCIRANVNRHLAKLQSGGIFCLVQCFSGSLLQLFQVQQAGRFLIVHLFLNQYVHLYKYKGIFFTLAFLQFKFAFFISPMLFAL